MKKILFAIVLAGGIFALSGCAKDCTCQAILNDEVVAESTVELDEGDKCSDYNTMITIFGTKVESKCTPNLF